MGHVHTSAIDFVVVFAHLVIALAIMRGIALTWPDSSVGAAFAFLN